MHFISTGRDHRIQRWITDQRLTSQPADLLQDLLESVDRKEHDELADMEWELEELERQMALTASVPYAFGWDRWAPSVPSLDNPNGLVDPVSLKRASQPSVTSQVPKLGGPASPRSELHKRREGWMISQACLSSQPPSLGSNATQHPIVPSELTGTELRRPNLLRARTVPPPIRTTPRASNSSARPPITFILQDSASPLPSAMHFTPTPPDLDAFPSTPRSFNSFAIHSPSELQHLGDSSSTPHPEDQFLSPRAFFSPRIQVDQRPEQAMSTPSPTTPHFLCTSRSDASTISLSAFPATPPSPGSSHPNSYPFLTMKSGDIPPVPRVPAWLRSSALPPLEQNRNKDLPPSPSSASPPSMPSPPYWPRHTPSSSTSQATGTSRDEADNVDGTRSESAISIADPLSSSFSVLSSRFSVSSRGSGWTGAGTQARADSRTDSPSWRWFASSRRTTAPATVPTGPQPRADSRPGSRSRAGSTAQGQGPLPPLPTTSACNLIRSVSRMGMGIKRSRSHGTLSGPRPSVHTQADVAKAPKMAGLTRPGGFESSTPPMPSSAVGRFWGTSRANSLRKQLMVLKGVRQGEGYEERVRRWCENLGAVKYFGRVPGSQDIHVHFQDKEVYKKVDAIARHHVNIPDVGSVTITRAQGSVHVMR